MRISLSRLSLKKKIIIGFSSLFFLSLAIMFYGLYRDSIQILKDKAEESLQAVSRQISQQIDKSFSQMETISNIFINNRKNKEMLSIESLDYIDQIRNYWQLQDEITSLSSYFSEYHLAIYLDDESLLAHENIVFFGHNPTQNEDWYHQTLALKGRQYWTGNSSYYSMHNIEIPSISSYRMITNIQSDGYAFIRISIAQQSIRDIFCNAQGDLPVSFYLFDDSGMPVIVNGRREAVEYFNLEVRPANIQMSTGRFHLLYNDIRTNGWHMITMIPSSYYDEILRSRQFFFLMLIGLLFAAYILVILSIWRSFDRRIYNIIRVLNRAEGQNYSEKLQIKYQDELSLIEVRINEFIDHIQNLTRNIIYMEKEKKKSEMVALQSQIRPHFIYNTLDSINWMALDRGHFEVSTAIVNLANFLRKNLSIDDEYVTVQDELDHVSLYVDIMKTRSDCIIELETDIPTDVLQCKTIKFIFQPIVENAIIHGFFKNNRPSGKIRISGQMLDDTVRIDIQDDGQGFTPEEGILTPSNGEGYGLRNVEHRLKLFHGEESCIKLESTPDTGTRVSIIWACKMLD